MVTACLKASWSQQKNACSQTLEESLGTRVLFVAGALTHRVTMTMKFLERPASDIFTACSKVTNQLKKNRRSHPLVK